MAKAIEADLWAERRGELAAAAGELAKNPLTWLAGAVLIGLIVAGTLRRATPRSGY